jgi:hypothetical protein
MTKLRAEFRQRRHHRAFRIAAAPDQPLLAELYEVLQALPEPEDPLDADALATAATNLWKAQRKLGQEGGPTATYLARCRDGLAGWRFSRSSTIRRQRPNTWCTPCSRRFTCGTSTSRSVR